MKWKKVINPVIFLLPTFILLGSFVIYPCGYTFYVSFFEWNGFSSMRFKGFFNYFELFKDNIFLQALRNNLIWIVLFLSFTVGIGLITAFFLEKVRTRFANIVKSILFLPMVISYVAAGIIWMFIYTPEAGILNVILRSVGLSSLTRVWLGDSHTALYALIIVTIWIWTGFALIIFSAGLKNIPEEIVEAAKLDGASGRQLFWYIILPLLTGPITVIVFTGAINALKIFDVVFTMTQGGPFHSSEVIAHRMYLEAFFNSKMGYGSAIAVIMFVIMVPFFILNIRRLSQRGE